jgi:hypothetical protein
MYLMKGMRMTVVDGGKRRSMPDDVDLMDL